MEKDLLKLNLDTDMEAMEVMEDIVDMEDMAMEKGLLKLMPNLDTDMKAMEVMEVMVMGKGPLNLDTAEVMVMVVMVMAEVMDTMVEFTKLSLADLPKYF